MALIDRDDTLAEIKRIYCTGCNNYNGVRCRACLISDAMDVVEDMPSIDAEPVRRGEWIRQDDTYTRYICSECKGRNYPGGQNYCPNCGARMKEEGSV